MSPGAIEPVTGSELLADLGFLHVPGRPLYRGLSYLLVALRRRPTLRHFDPERVEYWTAVGDRGSQQTLDRTLRMPHQASYRWGPIRVLDRKGVCNRFVSFGGHLIADRVGDLKVAVFSSSAPILAHGGHSEGRDAGSDSVASFFARLRAAAGRDTSFERDLLEPSALTLYACFVADSLRRYDVSELLRSLEPGDAAVLTRERHRLRDDAPAEWARGVELAERLLLDASRERIGDRRAAPTRQTGTPAVSSSTGIRNSSSRSM